MQLNSFAQAIHDLFTQDEKALDEMAKAEGGERGLRGSNRRKLYARCRSLRIRNEAIMFRCR